MSSIYPAAITYARARLIDLDLPDCCIRVADALVRKVNLSKLDSPIYARRDTLADETRRSQVSVGRALRWLEDNGLIERDQKAHRSRKGSTTLITLTRRMIAALNLDENAKRRFNRPASTLSEQNTVSVQDKSQEKDAAHSCVRIQGVYLPADLAWLSEQNELKATGVLHLMRQAKAHKKRLSDVVQATRNYLARLRGRELFAYLRSLIKTERDFAHVANQQDQQKQSEHERMRVTQKSEELIGRMYVSRKTGSTVTVEQGGRVRIDDGRATRYGALDIDFLDAIEDSRLQPVIHKPDDQ